jgi:streptogramin lyase
MTYVVKDRVKVTSTTTGTSTFTLGAAVDGFQSFASIASGSGWNISTSQLLQSFSVNAQDTSPRGLFFKPDGLKMYVVGSADVDVNEYNLSTAWDVRTASYLQNFAIPQGTSARGIFFRADGLKMYVVFDGNEIIAEYNLSSAWNISTASFLQSLSVLAQEDQPRGIFFKPDGLKMYVLGGQGNDVLEYNLSSAWNISTATYLQNFLVNGQDTNPFGLFFRSDGLAMYVTGATNSSVYQYSLGTAWNVTTASFVRSFSVIGQETDPQSVFFKPDGSVMYMDGPITSDRVFQYLLSANDTYYAITNGTDWELGIGTLSIDATELFRNTVLESSNSNALVNWGAGSKDVFCTFPADATEGTVPQGDTSQVGTDLVAWTNLKKELDRTVINGVPYNNNNTAGVVSTYSLVNTISNAYRSGVLSSSAEIHFIPFNATVGQKLNTLTNLVSTYSLVYTTSTGAFAGGVLAANGDIHFVKWNSNRGQKVDSSNVVSTYSLVHTAVGQTYFGGVLAPNGDIHFVPHGANRGQKVSAAGVVSTYSLVYTITSAYAGGVLSPNGDIHFVPYEAAVGQKISAAGVVSTYSLVYTASIAYSGGVLAPNGDIYFVPRQAAVGQKVSITGVVSTYSLVYTTSTGAYEGGVLAPNGDIHFVLRESPVGQKVSAAGVVSTYSLVLTAGSAYLGGVLAPNGDIHFINFFAGRGQKISTGTQRNIGYALSPFFNKF